MSLNSINLARTAVFNKMNDVKEVQKNRYKTRMCYSVNNGIVCPYGTKCNFAHTEAELRKVKCLFGPACKYIDTCTLDHSTDKSIEQMANESIVAKQSIKPDLDPFIIELDDDVDSTTAEYPDISSLDEFPNLKPGDDDSNDEEKNDSDDDIELFVQKVCNSDSDHSDDLNINPSLHVDTESIDLDAETAAKDLLESNIDIEPDMEAELAELLDDEIPEEIQPVSILPMDVIHQYLQENMVLEIQVAIMRRNAELKREMLILSNAS
jgi:hypothetical protein